MSARKIVTREQWLAARLELLKAEKELTRRGDELARRRQQLPWVHVNKEYVFDTEEGQRTLGDLFAGRSQLLVYHFMFGPTRTEGFPFCSLHADSFDRTIVDLNHRDVTILCVSRAPLAELNECKRRMGWSLQWVPALRNDLNYSFGVSLPAKRDSDSAVYKIKTPWGIAEEHAGPSAFALEDRLVYHTYSCYARGLEAFNVTYQLLDRAPHGRNEEQLAMPRTWLRRRDQYDL